MNTQNKITTDLKIAMKEKNEDVKSILRVVIGEFNRVGKEVSDDKAIAIIKKMVENAKEVNNTNEVSILKKYLPSQMDELELKRVLMNHLMNLGERPAMKHMGSTMKYLKENYSGQYDGKMASKIVRELINA